MATTTSLLSYLRQANPTVRCKWRSKSKSNTYSHKYPDVKELRIWESFEYDTVIEKLFGGALNKLLMEDYSDLKNVYKLSRSIYHEFSVTDIVKGFHMKIVTEALSKTTKRADLLGQEVSMLPGKGVGIFYRRSPEREQPDWAARSDFEYEYSILPGDSKLSKKFNTTIIEAITDDNGQLVGNQNHKAPLDQLAYYCIKTGMRYGYIITDKELFVLRVGTNNEEPQDSNFLKLRTAVHKNPRVEYQVIPWTNGDNEKQLTVNLALWALHILAANNGHLDWAYDELENEQIVPLEEKRRLEPDNAPSSSMFSNPDDRNTQNVLELQPQPELDTQQDIGMRSDLDPQQSLRTEGSGADGNSDGHVLSFMGDTNSFVAGSFQSSETSRKRKRETEALPSSKKPKQQKSIPRTASKKTQN